MTVHSIRDFFSGFLKTYWRMALAMTALTVSAWIGFRYENEIFVRITQILIWLYAILICFAALIPKGAASLFKPQLNRTWVGLIGLVGIAFLLRTVNLPNLPPGFHIDEAGSVEFSVLHVFNPDLNGRTISPFRTGSDSQPTMYSYILRSSIEVFGFTTTGARMSSALVGSLAIAAVFLLTDELSGRKNAWLAAILMTAYHFHIHWSRIALNNIFTTLLLPLAVGFFLRGWRMDNAKGALLAGLFLGLSAYFYTGGYVLVPLMIFLTLQTWEKTWEHARLAAYAGRMYLVATVTAAPIIIFALRQPGEFFDRFNTVYGWSRVAIDLSLHPSASYWEYFIHQMSRSFGAYNIFTDVTGFYAPGVPLLIGISSLSFLVGVFLAIRQGKHLLWVWILLVTVFGGVLLAGTPSSSHFVPAIPAVCALVALPLGKMLESKRLPWAYILLAGILLTDLGFYFMVYAANPSMDLNIAFPVIPP
ncbi:MAG TPA: glycosyltransferase family 39 protein [Anaerolineales bacterium]|nr:glycosyltransferase family 39 protein [Anaerolineales bacterium]